MKKFFLWFFSVLVFIAGLVGTMVYAQDEDEAAEPVDPEVINENIKERLKKVAEDQESVVSVRRKLAVMGELQSIANDTLTVKTKDDIKLASVSGETDYVRNPGSNLASVEDVAIGDFIIAMGFTNGSDVLEAKRVVLYDEAPELLNKQSVFGVINNIDYENETFTLTNSVGEAFEFELSSDTRLELAGTDEEIDFDEIENGQTTALVFSPSEDEAESDNLLLMFVLPVRTEVENETEEATESAEQEEEEVVPAELGQ